MHMILGMTALHTRILERIPLSNKTPAEAYHWFKAVALFNEKLDKGICPNDRDALWAIAILLGASMFTSCEAVSHEDAWPLKPPSSTDLSWLRITDGKKAIWKIADPLRSDSVFAGLAVHWRRDYLSCSTSSKSIIQSLPAGLLRLYELHTKPHSYYTTLCALAPLLNIDCNRTTILKYLSFISHFEPEFRELLFNKDAFAILILAHWYAKVCRYEWWIAQRAMLECISICIYLERNYPSDAVLQESVQCLRKTHGIYTR
jgi:hypothetical protein